MRRLSLFEIGLRNLLAHVHGYASPIEAKEGNARFLISFAVEGDGRVTAELRVHRSGEEEPSDLLEFMRGLRASSRHAHLYVIAADELDEESVAHAMARILQAIQKRELQIPAGGARMFRIKADGSEEFMDPYQHVLEFPRKAFDKEGLHFRQGQIVSVNCRSMIIRAGATDFQANPPTLAETREIWLRRKRTGRLVAFVPMTLQSGQRMALSIRPIDKRRAPSKARRLESAV